MRLLDDFAYAVYRRAGNKWKAGWIDPNPKCTPDYFLKEMRGVFHWRYDGVGTGDVAAKDLIVTDKRF
jgi:hypothetical protein